MKNYFEVFTYTLFNENGKEIDMMELTKADYEHAKLLYDSLLMIEKTSRTEYTNSTLWENQYKVKPNEWTVILTKEVYYGNNI